jgi:hypothetical protein
MAAFPSRDRLALLEREAKIKTDPSAIHDRSSPAGSRRLNRELGGRRRARRRVLDRSRSLGKRLRDRGPARVPRHRPPQAVARPARAPGGGSRTRRDAHLQLESRLPPIPRGTLAMSSRIGAEGSRCCQQRPRELHLCDTLRSSDRVGAANNSGSVFDPGTWEFGISSGARKPAWRDDLRRSGAPPAGRQDREVRANPRFEEARGAKGP